METPLEFQECGREHYDNAKNKSALCKTDRIGRREEWDFLIGSLHITYQETEERQFYFIMTTYSKYRSLKPVFNIIKVTGREVNLILCNLNNVFSWLGEFIAGKYHSRLAEGSRTYISILLYD